MTTPVNFSSKLYDLLVLLKIFLTKIEFQQLIKQVEEEWNNLGVYLAPNILNEVMIKAAFPKDWKNKL